MFVYERPDPNEEYIVTSDYAEGVGENCDYNVIHVYKRGDALEQVAWFRAKCYPEECASEAVALGAWYNMAWQVPEVNSCGAAALAIMRTCYPLDRIFRRRAPDKMKNIQPTDLLGWRMTGRSKSEAVSSATTYFKQGRCILHSPATIRELEVYVKKSQRALPEAMDGTDPVTGEPYHDDEATVMVLAIHANRQLPWRGGWFDSEESRKLSECRHLDVQECVCQNCGKVFEELKKQQLTFGKLRSIVKSSGSHAGAGRGSELLEFWTGGF